MKIELPKKEIPVQPNMGDKFGDFWSSYNLDLVSSIGKIRVSPTPYVVSDTDELMDNPVAFVRDASFYWAVCDQRLFRIVVNNLGSTIFARDSYDNSPTTLLSKLYSDAVYFNNGVFVSTNEDIARYYTDWDANWWTTTVSGGASTLTASIPHPLYAGSTVLLIGNGNDLIYVDIDNNYNEEQLVLPTDYEINWIRGSNSAYWIGARHRFGGEAKVFMWDGSSDYTNGDYKVGSSVVYSCVIKNEIPYVVNGNGQLLAFDGGGFTEVARFPIVDDKNHKLKDGVSLNYYNINRNGMALINGNINILVNAGLDGTNYTLLENMVSGIWEYTKETGLYHKHGITKNNTDGGYGHPKIVQAGALFPEPTYGYLSGAQLYTQDGRDVSTQLGTIIRGSTDTENKMGYFTTPKIYGSEIQEIWQKLYLAFSKLLNDGDSIILKYRTSVDYTPTFDAAGTWYSTSSFYSTATEMSDVSIGNEVEILSGWGAGISADITNLTSTYIVTLDTTVSQSVAGTLAFRVSNWKKIDSITDLVRTYKEITVGETSNWIQFKILLKGKGDSPEIEKLIITSQPQIKAQ